MFKCTVLTSFSTISQRSTSDNHTAQVQSVYFKGHEQNTPMSLGYFIHSLVLYFLVFIST